VLNKLIIQAGILIASMLIAYFVSAYVQISDFDKSLSTLQNVSIGVFTLVGIWIAIIYPQAISAFVSPDKISLISGSESTIRIESLVLTIVTTALVLVSILLLNVVQALIFKLPMVMSSPILFKVSVIGFIIHLVFNQIRVILYLVSSNLDFANELHKLNTKNTANNDLNE
jgi:hypothetical protein